MAHLGSKTTDGRLSFVKYVTDNKRYAEIEFEIEKGVTTPVFTKKSQNLIASKKELKGGDKIKIVDPKLQTIGKVGYAAVKTKISAGFIPINKIRKPTVGNGTQYEDEVVDLINEVILKAGPIDIKIKGSPIVYKKILYAVKVDNKIKQAAGAKGDPKADIILCQDIKNPLDGSPIFISHKKEGGPEAFQQYGGISVAAGRVIHDHPIVQKFLSIVADTLDGTDKLPHPVLATFDDKILSNRSIFGPDYGKKFSVDHTQLIGQGKPRLTPISNGKFFELTFSSHMSLSGDLSHFIGGYTPVLGASYRAGRGFQIQGQRYNGARVGIYPEKLIAGRSGTVVYNL